MDWICLAQDSEQWIALVNISVGTFMTCCAPGGFSSGKLVS
jgi:hypothetical protein